MIQQIADNWFQTDYLLFRDDGPVARGRKTRRFAAISRQNRRQLGFVKWYAQWRQYTFFPFAATVFDKKCLRELAEFCEDRTNAHKELNVPGRKPGRVGVKRSRT